MSEGLTEEQQNLYEQLKEAIEDSHQDSIDNILEGVLGDDLLKVLANANIIADFPHGVKCTLTLLGLAIGYNDKYGRIEPMSGLHQFVLFWRAEKKVKAMLNAAEKQGILEKVIASANRIADFPHGVKCTLTPLSLAIVVNNRWENVETILNAAEKQGILEKVLTTANIIQECPNGVKCTFTPLGWAIERCPPKITAMLNAAEKQGILEKVLTTAKNIILESPDSQKKTLMPLGLAIYCNGLSGITPILNAVANKGILGKVLATLDEDEYKYMLAKLLPAKVMRPSMITGGICCGIAALIVGGGCFAANFGLSTLVVVGIAVSTALVVGVVSGGITYAVLKFNHNKHFDNERSVNRNQSQESAKEMENFIEEPRHMDKATNTENVEELKPKEKNRYRWWII